VHALETGIWGGGDMLTIATLSRHGLSALLSPPALLYRCSDAVTHHCLLSDLVSSNLVMTPQFSAVILNYITVECLDHSLKYNY
jgi:hypothetical protein